VARRQPVLDKVPAGKPCFLWISFNDPHHRWTSAAIPQPHDPEDHGAALPAGPPQVRNDLARYYDEIARMDEEFQWVMDILARRGLATKHAGGVPGTTGTPFHTAKARSMTRG